MGLRFVVQTVSGYAGVTPRAREGLSAHVLDTAYNCAVVASYRSEDRFAVKGKRGRFGYAGRQGRERALQNAEVRADELNVFDLIW